ncbi:MAG: dTDP-4-dehydrorhamnose reductase [Alphaproteobacteria bacterium]|nr:dTDP-4-dehydrorhamnose reductase [Alphaproteobacteria bacterium]
MSAPRRILVAGAGGQVGRELTELPAPPDIELVGLDRATLDIAQVDVVNAVFEQARPDIVVNLAAYTAVDKAEAEPLAAFAANRDGAGILAQACRRRGIALVHVSTDYVFDGARPGPWKEDDPIGPAGVYARSKAEGEELVRDALPEHVILRTSWVFGAHGRNFVRTMLDRIGRVPELRVVDDQRGCPTAAQDLARALLTIAGKMLDRPRACAGTFHYCNAGVTTWFRFAQAVFARAKAHGLDVPRVIPIPTSGYPTPAPRPANSELDCTKVVATFGVTRPSWRDRLPPVVDAILAQR